MSLPLFLVEALPAGDHATLDGPEGHHAATVARLRRGERLLLADGRGGVAEAVVESVGRGALELAMGERSFVAAPQPALTVVQGIAKGDRGELAVQAMTEVGVDTIVPWRASRSIARWTDDRPLARWRTTSREAAKQARRAWLPTIAPAESTAAVAGRLAGGTALVLHEDATQRLSTVPLQANGEITLVVGPEGGIAPDELAAFEAAGAIAVRLGDTVLRTSTAGVAALAVLSARLDRW